jgi:hypothetical protein
LRATTLAAALETPAAASVRADTAAPVKALRFNMIELQETAGRLDA